MALQDARSFPVSALHLLAFFSSSAASALASWNSDKEYMYDMYLDISYHLIISHRLKFQLCGINFLSSQIGYFENLLCFQLNFFHSYVTFCTWISFCTSLIVAARSASGGGEIRKFVTVLCVLVVWNSNGEKDNKRLQQLALDIFSLSSRTFKSSKKLRKLRINWHQDCKIEAWDSWDQVMYVSLITIDDKWECQTNDTYSNIFNMQVICKSSSLFVMIGVVIIIVEGWVIRQVVTSRDMSKNSSWQFSVFSSGLQASWFCQSRHRSEEVTNGFPVTNRRSPVGDPWRISISALLGFQAAGGSWIQSLLDLAQTRPRESAPNRPKKRNDKYTKKERPQRKWNIQKTKTFFKSSIYLLKETHYKIW